MYDNQYPNQQQGYLQQQMYPEQGQLPKKKSTVGLMLGLSSLVIILLVISAVLLIIYGWVLITPKIDAEYFADHNWLEKESESYLVPTNSGTFKYYKDKDVKPVEELFKEIQQKLDEAEKQIALFIQAKQQKTMEIEGS